MPPALRNLKKIYFFFDLSSASLLSREVIMWINFLSFVYTKKPQKKRRESENEEKEN